MSQLPENLHSEPELDDLRLSDPTFGDPNLNVFYQQIIARANKGIGQTDSEGKAERLDVNGDQLTGERIVPVEIFPRTQPEHVFTAYQAAWEYGWEDGDLRPELVEQFFETYWRQKEAAANLDFQLKIPDCDRTPAELLQLRVHNRSVILIPDELMDPENANVFPKMYPDLLHPLALNRKVQNYSDEGGCIDVEMDLTAPHKMVVPTMQRRHLAVIGRAGQRLQTYVAASDISKILTGSHFDSTAESRLYGGKKTIAAYYDNSMQKIRFSDFVRQRSAIGCRTEGRK